MASARRRLPPAVAGGDPATAAAGLEMLATGGSAADAAVAMVLTASVAETIFTGIGGGGFATYFDGSTGTVTCLDFFVAVPGLDGIRPAAPETIEIVLGAQPLPYQVGAATIAVPGVPAGLADLHRRWGRLPWRDLFRPARSLAVRGAPISERHAALLVEIAPAMARGEGLDVYTVQDGEGGRRLLRTGEPVHHPLLVNALDALAEEGPGSAYTGSMAEALCWLSQERGGAVGPRDLAAYRVRELEPRHAGFVGRTVHLRGDDLDHTGDTLERLDAIFRAAPGIGTPVAVVGALDAGADRDGDTSNCAAVDGSGNACAVTTSLGLGAGEWWPGYGVHLNSMLGEGELLRGELTPGDRMGSMMTPLVVTDAQGPVLAGGAAGASRIRSSLAQVLTRVLRDGSAPQEAVDAPRVNPVPGPRIHCEPGLPESVLAALRETGAEVVVWPGRHSYFGGVSLVAEGGPAADPRRGGGTGVLP